MIAFLLTGERASNTLLLPTARPGQIAGRLASQNP